MENDPDPFLQTRAIILWMQGKKWSELIRSDFTTLVRNPHLNNLENDLKLPDEDFHYMYAKTTEIADMYVNYIQYGIAPWSVKGNEYYDEDIRILNTFQKMQKDANIFNEIKQTQKKDLEEHIAREKAKFQASRGVRGSR